MPMHFLRGACVLLASHMAPALAGAIEPGISDAVIVVKQAIADHRLLLLGECTARKKSRCSPRP